MVKITHGILVSTMYLKPKSFQDMFTKQIKQILYQWLFCFLHVCLFVCFPPRCAQKMNLYGELKGFMCLLVCISIVTSIWTGYQPVFDRLWARFLSLVPTDNKQLLHEGFVISRIF